MPNEAVLKLVADLNKKMKRPVIHVASDMPAVRRIPVGEPCIDYVMGGGTPVNRIIEFYGPESSGKTWAAIKAGVNFQNFDWNNDEVNGILGVDKYKEKKIKDATTGLTHTYYIPEKVRAVHKNFRMLDVVLIDVENTYDPEWGAKHGMDNKRLIRVVPETGEQAVDIAEAFLSDPNIGLVIFDSVALAKPKAVIDESMEKAEMGNTPRFWNRAAAKFQNALNRNPETNTTLIFINRAYMKVGLVFGNPEEIANGSGLKFAKSVSVKFQGMKEVKENIDGVDIVTCRKVKVENKKNKTGQPFRNAEYTFMLWDDEEKELAYGETDKVNDIIELGVRTGVVQKSGANYKFGRYSARGRENFEAELRAKPLVRDMIINKILSL